MFKKIKTLTTVCPLCEAERKIHYGTNDETLNVRGEEITVSAKVFYCPQGDHLFSNLEDDESKIQYAFREYRKRKKLLQPEEIIQIRNKYKLSQEAFSIFLGFGKKTIHRYETGAIPDDPHNSFIKFMQDTKNFILQYEQIKDKLTAKLKQKIEKRILELEISESQLSLYSYTAQPDIVVQKTTAYMEEIYDFPWDETINFGTYKHLTEVETTFKKKDHNLKRYASAA